MQEIPTTKAQVNIPSAFPGRFLIIDYDQQLETQIARLSVAPVCATVGAKKARPSPAASIAMFFLVVDRYISITVRAIIKDPNSKLKYTS